MSKMQDLIVDRIYEGGRQGNAGDDPLGPLTGVSNSGGFRILGKKDEPRLIVLTTGMADPDWPDELRHSSGQFIYYGDNKKPGRELHDTNRYGNSLLRLLFDRLHAYPNRRDSIPPILIFSGVGYYRDVKFLGLAVPGANGVSATDDLVAVWKTSQGQRFQNYRATFTILDCAVVPGVWLKAIADGAPCEANELEVFRQWKLTGDYKALAAEQVLSFRTRAEQLPAQDNHRQIVDAIRAEFRDDPIRFEPCAAAIAEMYLGGISQLEITRARRDGGRDAIGRLQLGDERSGIDIEFALEAKCYAETNSVGVRDLSRLISRLRFRQFGIFVTTSFVGPQAYQEIKEDGHPIIVLAARDIAQCLERHGLGNIADLKEWLGSF